MKTKNPGHDFKRIYLTVEVGNKCLIKKLLTILCDVILVFNEVKYSCRSLICLLCRCYCGPFLHADLLESFDVLRLLLCNIDFHLPGFKSRDMKYLVSNNSIREQTIIINFFYLLNPSP